MRRDIRPKTSVIKLVDWSVTDKIPAFETLESLLIKARDGGGSVTEWKLSDESQIRRDLIEIQGGAGGLAAAFIAFEIGKSIEVVQKDESTNKKSLKAIGTPQVQGSTREKLESALYFAVKGNRLSISQSVGLKVSTLEDYLSWLIQRVVPDMSGAIILKDDHPGDIEASILNFGVKEIVMKASFSDLTKSSGNEAETIRVANGLFSGLSPNWAKRLGTGFDATGVAGMKTRVVIETKTKASPEALALIKSIALGMRHDLSGISIVLGNGREIKGDSLIKKSSARIEFLDGNPVLRHIYNALRDHLSSES